MTDDLSGLKRMAEEMKLPGIISLIARVEKAEARVKKLEETLQKPPPRMSGTTRTNFLGSTK